MKATGKGWKNSAMPIHDGMKKIHAATSHHIAAHGKMAEKSMAGNAMHKGGSKEGKTTGIF